MSRIFRLGTQGIAVALVLAAVLAAGCQKQEAAVETGAEGQPTDTTAAPAAAAPAALAAGHIEVQHVLVGFQGSVPGKNITRSQDEAKKLAYEILGRAKQGEDFAALVQQHTDDQSPGIYRLADNGVAPEAGGEEYPRGGMVKGFSDAAFALAIGGVGIADFDRQNSPYGWHVIKRLR